MAPRRYEASSRPWRIGYWHQTVFILILFAANVVAVVTLEAKCLLGEQSLTRGKLVGAQGQDPCFLAARSIEICDDDPWTLLPLGQVQEQVYPVPGGVGGAEPTECSCSRVAYNLFSACAACQRTSGIHWVGYSSWDRICAGGVNKPYFDYSNDSTLLPWMSISDQDIFLVNEAIAAVGPTQPPIKQDGQDDDSTGSRDTEPPSVDTSAIAADTARVGTNQNSATTMPPNLLAAILAPILSVLALAALVGVWCYFRKRKRAKRVAPSAEFTKYQRAPIPLGDVEGSAVVGVRGMRSIDSRPASYALQNNGEEADGDAPPPFTPGLFKDPIFEKGVAMSLANQNASWAGRHGHASGTTTAAGGGADLHAGRQDSLTSTLAGGDSPASLSLLAPGQGQLERQRLIPPEGRD